MHSKLHIIVQLFNQSKERLLESYADYLRGCPVV